MQVSFNRGQFVLLMFLLAGANFMNYGTFIFGFAIIPVLLFSNSGIKKTINTKCFAILLVLTLLHFILKSFSTLTFDTTSFITELLMPIVGFVSGGALINTAEDKRKQLTNYVIYIGLANVMFGFLSSLRKGRISENYSLLYQLNESRNSLSIWNGSVIGGTMLAMFFLVAISYLYFAIFDVKSPLKWIMIISFAMATWSSFSIASRLNIVLTILILIILFAISMRRDSGLNRGRILVSLTVVLIAVIVIYHFDIFNVHSMIYNSTLVQRLQYYTGNALQSVGRIETYRYYLSGLFTHPFGGNTLKAGISTHNVFLQYGADGGIIVFLLAIAFFWKSYITIFRNIRSHAYDTVKYLIIPILITFLGVCMVESPMVSNPIIYSEFIMFISMFLSYYQYADEIPDNSTIIENYGV